VLNSDYKDMLQALLDNKVKFLLVGAYAMGVHGYPRATGDIDIWVEPSIDNSRRVYRSLVTFGAPLHEIDEATFTKPDEAYQQRQTVEIEELPIPILSRSDLIKNKRTTGRDKDRLDADQLENDGP
jgi:hypothetical protein